MATAMVTVATTVTGAGAGKYILGWLSHQSEGTELRSLPGRAISCHQQPESADALVSLSSESKLSVLPTVMDPV